MTKKRYATFTLVFSIILVLLQLNGIMYFLKYNSSNLNLLIVVAVPMLFVYYNFFMKKLLKKDTVKNVIVLFLLSCFVFFSLYYKKLEYIDRNYLLAAIGIISLIFISLRLLQSGMEDSISWTYKQRKGNVIRYLLLFLVPASVYGVALTACYPGLISPDSLYLYNMAYTGGPYNNLHPLMYTLFIRFLVLLNLDLFKIMILQCLMVALSYSYISYSFYKLGIDYFYSFLLVIIMTIYPINLFNTITFWKDIPYTIGLSLITVELVKIAVKRDETQKIPISEILILIFATVLTLFSRHNGILSVCLTYLIASAYYIIKHYRGIAFRLAVLLLGSVVVFYGSFICAVALLGDKYVVPEDNKVTETAKYALRIQGLINVYGNRWSDLDDADKAYIDKYLDLDEVDAHIQKYDTKWPYVSRTKAYCDTDALLEYDGIFNTEFNRGYFNLLRKYPSNIINAYTCTTAIIWSTPSYGYTMHAAYPFEYYDTSHYPDMPFRIGNYLPGVKDFIIKIYYMEPTKSYYALFWRPAVFLLAILYLLYYGYRNKVFGTFLIAAPALFNSVGYLIIIEAQDARYFYINLTTAIIMFCYTTMNKKSVNEEEIN